MTVTIKSGRFPLARIQTARSMSETHGTRYQLRPKTIRGPSDLFSNNLEVVTTLLDWEASNPVRLNPPTFGRRRSLTIKVRSSTSRVASPTVSAASPFRTDLSTADSSSMEWRPVTASTNYLRILRIQKKNLPPPSTRTTGTG